MTAFRQRAARASGSINARAALDYDRAMQYRTFGRTGWPVSEIGYGMWGMAGGWGAGGGGGVAGGGGGGCARTARRGGGAGMQFLRPRGGEGRGRERAAAGGAAEATGGKPPLRPHKDPAEKPPVARARRVRARR